MYSDDMADACVFLLAQGIGEGLYNVGCGEDVTIRELAETVMDVVGFKGRIVFDRSNHVLFIDETERFVTEVTRFFGK